MSLDNCIALQLKNKNIPEKYAKKAQDYYEKNFNYYKATLGNNDIAAERATTQTIADLEHEHVHAKFKIIRQKEVQNNIKRMMDEYGDGQSPAKAMQALIEQDEISTYTSLAYRQRAYHGVLVSKMEEAIIKLGKRGLGIQGNQALQRDMVKAIFNPDDVADETAKILAKAWKDASEEARLLFNRMGGQIPKREDWGLSQIHNPYSIERAGFEDWYAFIKDRLDFSKIYSERFGRNLQGDEEIKDALRETYETIVSDGWSQIKPSAAVRGKSLSNRRMDHRFLVFKSGDDWFEYQQKFGDPNPFNNMMNHLDRMSKDIAQLEMLGPNPNATISFIEQEIRARSSKLGKEAQTKINADITYFKGMYDIYTGLDQQPANGNIARGLAATRSLLQAAQLGAAAISAIGDLNTQRIAAKAAGLPVNKVIGRIVSNLANAEDSGRLALRLGLIADNWISTAAAQQRYFGEISAPGIASSVSDFVMRASGLSAWTQAGRFAFGMEFMGHLADSVGKQFDELDRPLQTVLARYGLDTRWNEMRSTTLYNHEGATFLRPDDMRSKDSDLALRYLEMINRETDFAVPTTNIRAKAFLGGGTKPGTFMGEIIKSVAMYKNYAVTLLNNNMMRAWRGKEYSKAEMGLVLPSKFQSATRFADIFIGATVMGGLAIQLKEMSKGRDPRQIDNVEFFAASVLQGGALGIFGDFFTSSTNRFGGGLGETIAGPVVGLSSDLMKLTAGNIAELVQDEDTNFIKEATRFTGRYAPGQSIWYLNLAFRRLILEQFEDWADPKARQRYNKQMQKYRRETGQEFWWTPAETSPSRSPEISTETLLD